MSGFEGRPPVVVASLCLRFYRDDGWTRARVSALGPAVEAVVPRAYEGWIDDGLKALAAENPHYDSRAVDYYAVYSPEEEAKLPTPAALAELGHEIRRITDF